MAIVPIRKIPDEVLTKKAEKVTDFDAETEKVIKDMTDTLNSAKDPEGAGIAATQIGVSKRICIVKNFAHDPLGTGQIIEQTFILINPKIISFSKETEVDWEGCLSVPDTYGLVERSKKIKVRALNENQEDIKLNASGYFARVIQHEIDHLDGILFTNRSVGKTISNKEMDDLIEAGASN
jgi:peptide deformylase